MSERTWDKDSFQISPGDIQLIANRRNAPQQSPIDTTAMLAEMENDSYGGEIRSEKHIERQDKVLHAYQKFVSERHSQQAILDNLAPHELNQLYFPSPDRSKDPGFQHEVLCQQMKAFFFQYAMLDRISPGIDRREGRKSLHYSVLSHCRQALVRLSIREYTTRQIDFDPKRLTAVLTETINFITKKSLEDTSFPFQVVYGCDGVTLSGSLNLSSFLVLVQNDLEVTPCPELAIQHHLAWSFGLIFGLRPGSLAKPPEKYIVNNREPLYLTWGDILFERHQGGRIIARIKIRDLKTNQLQPDAGAKNKSLDL